MPMTNAQVYAHIRELIGNKPPSEVSNRQLDIYLSSAVDSHVRELGFQQFTDEASMQLEAGKRFYPLPPDVEQIIWVAHNDQTLTPQSTQSWDRDGVNWRSAHASIPEEFAIEGRNLVVYPPPSADAITLDPALSYHYYRSVSSLDNSLTNLPSSEVRTVIMMAAMEWLAAHPNDENQARINNYAAIVAGRVASAKKRFDVPVDDYYPTMKPATGRQGGAR